MVARRRVLASARLARELPAEGSVAGLMGCFSWLPDALAALIEKHTCWSIDDEIETLAALPPTGTIKDDQDAKRARKDKCRCRGQDERNGRGGGQVEHRAQTESRQMIRPSMFLARLLLFGFQDVTPDSDL